MAYLSSISTFHTRHSPRYNNAPILSLWCLNLSSPAASLLVVYCRKTNGHSCSWKIFCELSFCCLQRTANAVIRHELWGCSNQTRTYVAYRRPNDWAGICRFLYNLPTNRLARTARGDCVRQMQLSCSPKWIHPVKCPGGLSNCSQGFRQNITSITSRAELSQVSPSQPSQLVTFSNWSATFKQTCKFKQL